MTFQDYFPIWNKLQTDQQDRIRSNLNFRTVKKGTILHNGDHGLHRTPPGEGGAAPGLYPL